MINLKLVLIIITFFITINSTPSQSQTIKGDGVVIRENRNIPSFSKIQICGVLNGFLTQETLKVS